MNRSTHAVAPAALGRHGYRSANRDLVLQCLREIRGLEPEQWRVFALRRERRNLVEY
jgi:hypothetical protein